MSIPLNSTGPTPPSGSSNPVSFKNWFIAIIDWIKGLSPAGATVYDTGPVNLTAGNSWSAQNYTVQRIGKVVYLGGEVWGGTIGSVITTLDPQFRPRARVGVELRRAGANNAVAKLYVETSGVMTIYEGNGAASSPGLAVGTISWLVA